MGLFEAIGWVLFWGLAGFGAMMVVGWIFCLGVLVFMLFKGVG